MRSWYFFLTELNVLYRLLAHDTLLSRILKILRQYLGLFKHC